MSAHTPTPNETIEDAAENFAIKEIKECTSYHDLHYGFTEGAKWQSEQSQSELESLRAERDWLVEALRLGRNELMRAEMSLIECGYGTGSSTIQSIENAIQTLAKYAKK